MLILYPTKKKKAEIEKGKKKKKKKEKRRGRIYFTCIKSPSELCWCIIWVAFQRLDYICYWPTAMAESLFSSSNRSSATALTTATAYSVSREREREFLPNWICDVAPFSVERYEISTNQSSNAFWEGALRDLFPYWSVNVVKMLLQRKTHST